MTERPDQPYEGFRVDRADDVVTVTLCRPDRRNAQTPAFWRSLAAIGREVPGTARVVLLRAEGQSFSAGLDRRMLTPDGIPGEVTFFQLAAASPAELDAHIGEFQEAFTWLRDPSFVSVAAVQGHAVGAGFQLALSCDLRVVADDVQFCMREPVLGLVPDLTGTQPLVEAVGYARALEICATGRWVGAEESVRIGLALLAVPADQLAGAADDLVKALLVAQHGAVSETKALLQAATGRTLDEQRAAERTAQGRRLAALAALAAGG